MPHGETEPCRPTLLCPRNQGRADALKTDGGLARAPHPGADLSGEDRDQTLVRFSPRPRNGARPTHDDCSRREQSTLTKRRSSLFGFAYKTISSLKVDTTIVSPCALDSELSSTEDEHPLMVSETDLLRRSRSATLLLEIDSKELLAAPGTPPKSIEELLIQPGAPREVRRSRLLGHLADDDKLGDNWASSEDTQVGSKDSKDSSTSRTRSVWRRCCPREATLSSPASCLHEPSQNSPARRIHTKASLHHAGPAACCGASRSATAVVPSRSTATRTSPESEVGIVIPACYAPLRHDASCQYLPVLASCTYILSEASHRASGQRQQPKDN